MKSDSVLPETASQRCWRGRQGGCWTAPTPAAWVHEGIQVTPFSQATFEAKSTYPRRGSDTQIRGAELLQEFGEL
jgi:hypothetical protein